MELVLLLWIGCALLAGFIGSSKNRSFAGSALLGLLLGIIGVMIVLLRPTAEPPAPRGMRSVKCLRCNAVQNVPVADASFGCWQCHAVNAVQPHFGEIPPAPPKQVQPPKNVKCFKCGHIQVASPGVKFKCAGCGEKLKIKLV